MTMQNPKARKAVPPLVAGVVLMGIYACGIFISEEAVAGSFLQAGLPPSLQHPFGTDALGRDLLMRTLKGLSVSMTIGIAASLISGILAIFAGLASAGKAKILSAFMNWTIDLAMSVPHTILVILISFALGRGFFGVLAGIAATHWCSLARLIRGELLQLHARQYVAVSRRLGKSEGWIFLHHFLPHLMPQFLVGLVLVFPHAVLHEASISFLGFGLSPEQPAIGIILSESMKSISAGMWWPAVFPGAVLACVVLLADKLGNSLGGLLSIQNEI